MALIYFYIIFFSISQRVCRIHKQQTTKIRHQLRLIVFLIYVGKHPGCTPGELTKALNIDWGHSQRSVTKLVDDGFITKNKSGRIYHLDLTEKGQQAFQVSHQVFFDWDKEKLSALTDTERKQLFGLLQKATASKEDPLNV